MLRRPKHSTIEVVGPKEEEEDVFKHCTATKQHSLATSSQASQPCTCFHPLLCKK